jgi:hypothetical protein
MKNAVIGLFIILLGAVAWYFLIDSRQSEQAPPQQPVLIDQAEPEPAPEPDPDPPRQTVLEDAVEMPEPEPVAESEPLPALAESDTLALESLGGLLGEAPVMQFLVDENVVSRFVASVDALTSRQVPGQIMAVRELGGELEVTGDEHPVNVIRNDAGDPIPQFIMDPANHQRYAAQVEMFEAVNATELVDLYQDFAPLFEQAWIELGYPEGGFEERLIEVIDNLLATPESQAPIRLIKPEAFYLFADPSLESLPAGQKILLRMGNSNAGRVKVKLREIREILLAA